MIAEKAPKRRAAYGLPPNMNAFLESAQHIQSEFSKGLRPDGSYKPETIQALLKFRRVNVTVLTETNDYSEAYFRQVIQRECRDVAVEDIIAGVLGIEGDKLWGRCLLGEVANAS